MAQEFGAGAVFEMDVASDESIAAAFATLGKKWDGLDIVVHAVAFAPSDAIRGGFVESTTRENFRIAHDISSYSLTALAKAAEPMMQRSRRRTAHADLPRRGALAAELQRDGRRQGEPRSERALPRRGPGPEGHSRQRDFGRTDQDARGRGHRRLPQDAGHVAAIAPLRRNVTIEDVGNTAAFLCSDLAAGITGEVDLRRRRLQHASAWRSAKANRLRRHGPAVSRPLIAVARNARPTRTPCRS